MIKKLWTYIGIHRQAQFYFLLFLMLGSAFFEIISIGSALPFLSAITSPETLYSYEPIKPIITILKIKTPSEILLPATFLFGLSAIIAAGVRLMLLKLSMNFSYGIGAEIGAEIYRRTIYQPYLTHCERNSSEIVSSITTKTNDVTNAVYLFLTLIVSSIILFIMMLGLFLMNPVVTLICACGFGSIYSLIGYFTRQKLYENSKVISRESSNVLRFLQEGLGAIRDILIDGSQDVYCAIYKKSDFQLRQARASNAFISASPRFIVEALGLLFFSISAFYLSGRSNAAEVAVPILGVFALGAQRALPLMQQIYASWTGVEGVILSLQDTLLLLGQPIHIETCYSSDNSIPFKKSIQLANCDFRYAEDLPWIFKGLNFTVQKGDCIGIIGLTGGGKSTLLDLIMALLTPTDGMLLVDGLNIQYTNSNKWQKNIAHVPQSIFLSDASIAENIAFGVPPQEIDYEKVRISAQYARISEVIESWPEQYRTNIGERGVRLSGGQRQRIGIARALYKEAEVIIFDEATSSLDVVTENSIMDCIYSLNRGLTVIIVAHRTTTLKNCNRIVQINSNGTISEGTYYDIRKGFLEND